MLFHSLCEVSFGFGCSFFLKRCWGTYLNGGTKRIGGGDLPWMMPFINLLQKDETGVIKLYQRRAFQKEISPVENGRAISDQISIYNLEPFLDNHGVLRVHGRINMANLDYELKHAVLLPKEGNIMHAILRDHHKKVAHAGQEMTINEICIHRYLTINCNYHFLNKVHFLKDN